MLVKLTCRNVLTCSIREITFPKFSICTFLSLPLGQVRFFQVALVGSAVAKNFRSMFKGHVLQSSSFSTPHSVHQSFSLFPPTSVSGLCQLTASMATARLVNKLCCAEDRAAQTCFYFDMPYFTSPSLCTVVVLDFFFLKLLQNVFVHG